MKRLMHTTAFFQTVAVGLFVAAVPAVLFLVGCDSTERSTGDPIANTGKTAVASDNPPIPAGLLSEEMVGQTVSVTGEVVEQCPASGCWFKVKTESGETFVDLIPSPVRLSKNRAGQEARVTGEVVRRGSDLAIEAQQVEFGPAP